jgi:hypothetical protein
LNGTIQPYAHHLILFVNGGLTDSDNNTNDFVTISPPAQRNSSSAFNPPSAPPASAPALSVGLLEFTVTGHTTGTNYIV